MVDVNKDSNIDYRTPFWPSWAKHELGIRLWGRIILDEIVTFVGRMDPEQEGQKREQWAEPLYQSIKRRIEESLQETPSDKLEKQLRLALPIIIGVAIGYSLVKRRT